MLNDESRRRTGNNQRADSEFEFGHGHKFEEGESASRSRNGERCVRERRSQSCGRNLDRVCGNHGRKRGGSRRHAVARQDCAEFFQRAIDTFSRGVFVAAQIFADLREALLFKKTEQQGVAVGFVQAIQRFVEQRADLFPVVIFSFGFNGVHRHGLLFARAAAAFAPEILPRGKNRGAMQPAGQHDIFGKGRGFAREVGEDELRDVLREMRVAAGLPERGGINERDVARDKFAERGFGTVGGKSAQKLSVIGHFPYIQPQNAGIGQKKVVIERGPQLNSLY